MTWNNSLDLSEPQFSHHKMGIITAHKDVGELTEHNSHSVHNMVSDT